MNPQAPAAPAPQPGAAPPPASAGITGASSQAPTAINLQAAPQYDAGAAMGAIKQFYQIPAQAANAAAGVKADAYNAQTSYENSIRQAELKKQQIQDSLDPGKYHAQPDPNGGPTKILNSQGQEVSVAQFHQLTGEDPTTILKGTTNLQEKQFIQDYQNYENFMQSLLGSKSGDKQAQTTYQDFLKNNPGLDKLTPDQVRQTFMQQYGSYFNGSQGGDWQKPGGAATPGVNHFAPENTLPALENQYRLGYYGSSPYASTGGSGFGVDLSGLSPTGQ